MTAEFEVYLALGSNVGDRAAHLQRAVDALAWAGTVSAVSSAYETEPTGITDQPAFLNAALRLRTRLGPLRLFVFGKSVEFAAGRRPGLRGGPRPLDIDIVAHGELRWKSPRLEIPHPRFADRPFVLVPLREIAPDFVAPGFTASVRTLADQAGEAGVQPASCTIAPATRAGA
ncbi:MAG: 2-amino-4-hydroxy-6-hydroxymethyldihydropteridine diphosphokinase [Actinobacteria bacterium]|nr:2-amino-4-hydroxy-6-hydroxymethyldihydropteridine diphosphokinase [Actinomycetota bacterium]